MKYVEVSFSIIPFEPWNEIIIANLSILPYESFMEEGEYLKAYIQEQYFDPLDFTDICAKMIEILNKSNTYYDNNVNLGEIINSHFISINNIRNTFGLNFDQY